MTDTNSNLAPRLQALKLSSEWDAASETAVDSNAECSPQLPRVTGTPVIIKPPQLKPSATALAKLPPLPADARQCGRYYFFGWHITTEWLRDLALKNHFPPAFAATTDFDGLRYIAWKSGYKYSWPVIAKVEKGEHFEPQYPRKPGSNVFLTDVLMVWVNHQDYVHRWPTEAQMQKLVEIFGKEGRWFKDGKSPRKFLDYEMDDDSPSMTRNRF